MSGTPEKLNPYVFAKNPVQEKNFIKYYIKGFSLRFTDPKKFTLWYMHEDNDGLKAFCCIGFFCMLAMIYSMVYNEWDNTVPLGGHYRIVTNTVITAFHLTPWGPRKAGMPKSVSTIM